MRTLRLFAFLLSLDFRSFAGFSEFAESSIIGIKMLKTLLKMLKNQHNFEYFCFGYFVRASCGAALATMGLHGSVWRFAVVLVSGVYFEASWLCVAYSAFGVTSVCRANGVIWNFCG